jgi:hypothetical protein
MKREAGHTDGSYLVFAVKLQALRNTQNLAGLKIRADDDGQKRS